MKTSDKNINVTITDSLIGYIIIISFDFIQLNSRNFQIKTISILNPDNQNKYKNGCCWINYNWC